MLSVITDETTSVETYDVEPPAVESLTAEPPAVVLISVEPTVVEPPALEPPATEPPTADPPAAKPTSVEPPAVEPPATEPPTVEQSAVGPTSPLSVRQKTIISQRKRACEAQHHKLNVWLNEVDVLWTVGTLVTMLRFRYRWWIGVVGIQGISWE